MSVSNTVNRVRHFSLFNLHNVLEMEFQIRRENVIPFWRNGKEIQNYFIEIP